MVCGTPPRETVRVTSPEHADKEGGSCEYRLDGQSWAGENRGHFRVILFQKSFWSLEQATAPGRIQAKDLVGS